MARGVWAERPLREGTMLSLANLSARMTKSAQLRGSVPKDQQGGRFVRPVELVSLACLNNGGEPSGGKVLPSEFMSFA